MRRSLHQTLRTLERKKATIESQIGKSEEESKPLQEMRDQWRSVQVTHLDSELARLRGMNSKSTESSLITSSKVHSLHELPRSDRSGVYRNSSTGAAVHQERMLEAAIKKQKKREAVKEQQAGRRVARAQSSTPTMGHRKLDRPFAKGLTVNPYANENARFGGRMSPSAQDKARRESIVAEHAASPSQSPVMRQSSPNDARGKALGHAQGESSAALILKANQILEQAGREGGQDQQADKPERVRPVSCVPAIKAATAPFLALSGVRKSGDKKAPKSLDEVEDMVQQQRLAKSVMGEISVGAYCTDHDMHFLKVAAGELPQPTHDKHSLESFDPSEPEAITSPRSVDIICRFGLAPDDLRLFTMEHYTKKCTGNEARAKMWFAENEKRRTGFLKRLRSERRKLIKELTLTAKGRSSKASSTSASDAFPLGRVSSIPPLMPDAQAGGRGGEGDLSVDLGGLEASAHSGHKLVSVPHWGGVMDTTKAALKETADKERALNAKLAKAEKRRTDNLLASLLERKTQLDDCDHDLERKHREREARLAEKKKKVMLELQMRSAEHQRRHEALRQDQLRKQQLVDAQVAQKLKKADENLERISEERRVQLEHQAELMRIKTEIGERRLEQKERMQMYEKQKQIQRIWQDDERLGLKAAALELLQEERKEMHIQLKRDREIVGDLVDEFNREGTLHKSLQAHAAKGPLPKQVKYLLHRGNVKVAKGDMDLEEGGKNPAASRISRNTEVSGVVETGQYCYFKLLITNPRASIKISLKSKSGDPDLVVGNSSCPKPTKENTVWKKAGFGDDKITINFFDESFQLGWFYVGVYGAGRLTSEFSLTASWKEAHEM